MNYLLVLLSIPFLVGFCPIGSVCPLTPNNGPRYQTQPIQPIPPVQSFSNTSPLNPYATNPPKIYSDKGKYLGQLSVNPYLPDSTGNPYGQYGSPYSPDSINNIYGGN